MKQPPYRFLERKKSRSHAQSHQHGRGAGPKADGQDVSASDQQQLDYIASLTRNARTSWFTLLGLLLFCGVTLLRFEHIDFYGYERSTDLPLIGLSIPTQAFFFVAPWLCAAVYSYLHLYLIRLWDALGRAPAVINGQPLSRLVPPWLVTDVFLHTRSRKRSDQCRDSRPLEWLSALFNTALIYISGCIVLAFMWYQSAVARDIYTTIGAAASLCIMVLMGLTSHSALRSRAANDCRAGQEWPAWILTIHIAAFLASSSYFRTTEPAPWMTVTQKRDVWDEETQTTIKKDITLPRYKAYYDYSILGPSFQAATLKEWQTFFVLAEIDLEGEALVERPAGWLPFEQRIQAFQKQRCAGEEEPAMCEELSPNTLKDVYKDYFIEQKAMLSSLKKPDWHKAGRKKPDFRGANLKDTLLLGLDLSGARFDQAVLQSSDASGANMFGAAFYGADMSEAKFHGADMTFAAFHGAEMYNAKFHGAEMYNAKFHSAEMSDAVFHGAEMSGAAFHGADMYSAAFHGAKMNFAAFHRADIQYAEFHGAKMNFAAFHGTNVRFAGFDREHLQQIFFDGSVQNRDTVLNRFALEQPCHWVDQILTLEQFQAHVRGVESYLYQKEESIQEYQFDDDEVAPQACLEQDRSAD